MSTTQKTSIQKAIKVLVGMGFEVERPAKEFFLDLQTYIVHTNMGDWHELDREGIILAVEKLGSGEILVRDLLSFTCTKPEVFKMFYKNQYNFCFVRPGCVVIAE